MTDEPKCSAQKNGDSIGITHADLVARAAKWLRNQGCGVVLTEFGSSSIEIPDAIGWATGGRFSTLVECKTSRSDFYADKKKPGRIGITSAMGIGRCRYYLTPPGLLTPEMVREQRPRWGLIEAHPRTVRTVLKAEPFSLETAWRELPLLYSYARRIEVWGVPLVEVVNLVQQESWARQRARAAESPDAA